MGIEQNRMDDLRRDTLLIAAQRIRASYPEPTICSTHDAVSVQTSHHMMSPESVAILLESWANEKPQGRPLIDVLADFYEEDPVE
jgi:hypothetical protein